MWQLEYLSGDRYECCHLTTILLIGILSPDILITCHLTHTSVVRWQLLLWMGYCQVTTIVMTGVLSPDTLNTCQMTSTYLVSWHLLSSLITCHLTILIVRWLHISLVVTWQLHLSVDYISPSLVLSPDHWLFVCPLASSCINSSCSSVSYSVWQTPHTLRWSPHSGLWSILIPLLLMSSKSIAPQNMKLATRRFYYSSVK